MLAAGRRLDHEILSDASGIDSRALRDALREAVAAQLVVADEEGRYAFRHALLREVVVDDLLPGERAELHLALARALEHRAEGLPAHGGAHLAAGIAHHYLASGDQPKALVASVRAAEAAEAVHANGEAAALYSRALQLWDRVADAEELDGPRPRRLLRAAALHDRQGARAGPRRDLPARRAARARRLATRCAPPTCSSTSPASSSARAARPTPPRRAASALDLLPEEPSKVRATLLAQRGQGADARVAPRRGRRGRRGGARGRPRRRATRSPSCARWTAWASRCSASAATRRARRRCARRSRGCASAGSIHVPVLARQPRRRAGRRRPAGRGARGRRRGRRARGREGRAAALADAAALRAGVRGRRLGGGRGGAARRPGAPRWARRSSTTRCGGSSSRSAAATTTTRAALLDQARDVAADTREPQWIGPLGSLRAELERRAGDLDAARAAIDDALDRLDFCSQDVARMARVAATGVRVEADAAVRARDLGEDPSFAIGTAEALIARVEACAEGDRPVEAAFLASARAEEARAAGRRRPGAVDRRRRRLGGARAPVPRRAGAAPQGRGAAGARRARGGGRERRSRRSPPRSGSAPRGSRRRSRASRCARGCGWSPTSLRRHPRYPPRMPAKTRSGSRRASARCSRCSPMGARTARSASRSTWPRRPRASMSRASSPSSTCAHAPRPRRWPTGWVWSRRSRRWIAPIAFAVRACRRRSRTAWR